MDLATPTGPGSFDGDDGAPGAAALIERLRARRVVALVGAGLSTESGIPDYRGHGGLRGRRPIQYREFVAQPRARARYWARSLVGWARISGAQPNAGHRALAALEASGAVAGVLTQNVDGLHQAAGTRRLIELHGSLWRVRCLGCDGLEARPALAARLAALNPGWAARTAGAPAAPDGDADVDPAQLEAFSVPACRACGGVLKPDVVFFGENVPRPVVEEAYRIADSAEVLLVLGSSLTVYSGFRFVRRATERGQPVVIVNLGPTRGDGLAALKLEARLGALLPAVARALGS